MVLEGVVLFDLKANTLISDGALGNELQYLVCPCDIFCATVLLDDRYIEML